MFIWIITHCNKVLNPPVLTPHNLNLTLRSDEKSTTPLSLLNVTIFGEIAILKEINIEGQLHPAEEAAFLLGGKVSTYASSDCVPTGEESSFISPLTHFREQNILQINSSIVIGITLLFRYIQQ